MKEYTCFQCDGFGKIFFRNGNSIDCDMCEGLGQMSGENVLWKLQGEILKDWRMSQGLTLRKCANKYQIDPSNLSKMERGIIKPNANYVRMVNSL
jgi:predicted transcriptional regulator